MTQWLPARDPMTLSLSGERRLFTTDPKSTPLLGKCIAFLRMSTKRYQVAQNIEKCTPLSSPRYLSDETFQREIMVSPIDNSKAENLLWMVERQVIQLVRDNSP